MDPPDFIPENFEDILAGLTDEDFEKISRLAEQFTSEKSESYQKKEKSDESNGFSIDPQMLMKLMNIFQKLNSRQDDPRCNLIAALKPLLSPERRKKADTAMEILRIFSVFSMGDIFSSE